MIWAGIVVYYPKENRLVQNIESIKNQVAGIIIYNNGCNKETKRILEDYRNDKFIVIDATKNEGIGKALNCIMNRAEQEGAKWVVTYDQDSISPDNLIDEYRKRLSEDNLAILCPRIVDKRRIYLVQENVEKKDAYVERCITSASCTKIEYWKAIGGFDEYLFIDLVDNDFCKRIRINGYLIKKINSIVLDQEYGDITMKSPRTVEIIYRISRGIKSHYLARNVAKLTYKKNVSPLRVYYTNRNLIYLNKKYKYYGGIGYDTYCCHTYAGFMITFNLSSLLRGKYKMKILSSIIRGVREGNYKSRHTSPYRIRKTNEAEI